tara:strand:+ start:21956 stop:22201 length:246 start_codon:yes stop_codon:yes gene_type:complete
MRTLENVKSELTKDSNYTIRVIVEVQGKYFSNSRHLEVTPKFNGMDKKYYITNGVNNSSKKYETEELFFNAVKRLLKNQVS